MANPEKFSGSYWDLIRTAEKLLNARDFSGAERHLDFADARRDDSPGRVFFTEKISDGIGRLFQRGQQESSSADFHGQGRWLRHREEFRFKFLALGDQTVRKAVHLAELRPEDDAHTNQPILEQALHLVGRSRIFAEEPASAVPILKGLFRTARRTGRPFAVDLVRHDLPLTEEDRLWLARRGGELVEEFQLQGTMAQGSREAEEWARVCLQLLNPRYFGQTGRLEEERSWVEAMTADHLLGRAAESVEAYRKYLAEYPTPSERADEARVRLLELLANIDGLHFQVPHYDEALSALQLAGLEPGSAMAGRFEAALARIEHRCPDPEPGSVGNPAWASLALEADGSLAAIFWWADEPRDVAYWRLGEDPGHMEKFLEPCEGRLICSHRTVVSTLEGVWDSPPAVWTVQDFATALLEANLPVTGLDPESLLRIGMGETAAWRSGWSPDHGHPHLEPPRRSTLAEAWQGGPAGSSLVAGLLLLAVRTRLATADPCLRAGIRLMARRGDAASGFLYQFLILGRDATAEVDSSFQPWTLPLLWTRSDPFGWSSAGNTDPDSSLPAKDTLSRPDLGRNDLAIVSTGDPAAVVAAWGDGRQKWRIVLDRSDRLEALSRVAGGAIGPVTLIPPSAMVHDLDQALAQLEKMLTPEGCPSGIIGGLLPLFHWSRLVESHNGDLLDFQQVRPRLGVEIPLYDEYRIMATELPLEEPRLDSSGEQDGWATQFSQRVRKAGFVAGMVENLVPDAQRLDSLWGVYEGSDASWVFLDSAAIHWSLLGREAAGIQELHSLLHSRGHRHLSLLTGAVWLRSELEELLGTWLMVFGTPYCVGLTDGRPPRLRLADRGLVPDSRLDPVLALSGQVTHVRQSLTGDAAGTILLPGEGLSAHFWHDIATGGLSLAARNWHFLRPARHAAGDAWAGPGVGSPQEIPTPGRQTLLVPVLASLERGEVPIALADSPEEWATADQNRHSFLNWRRKLCGLEIASLMAGTWQSVEIMDPRWWRLLRSAKGSEPGTADRPWTGALASALASADGCTTFNLPGSGLGKDDYLPSAITDAVGKWYSSLPAESPQPARGLLPVAQSWNPKGGTRLLVGDSAVEWSSITQYIGRKWERGDLSSWALLVSDQLPGPTADLVSTSWTPGISAWPFDAQDPQPAAILWVCKTDFSNQAFVDFLASHRPALVMACGIQDWLPAHDGGCQIGAHALRILLDCGADSLILQADELVIPWSEFLLEATGAHLTKGAAQPVGLQELQNVPTFPGSMESLYRLRQLLARLELVLPGRGGTGEAKPRSLVSGRQLVSVHWLALLAGISEPAICQGVRILRWAGRLQGDSLSAASGLLEVSQQRPVTHALLIPRRFAEIEHLLKRLEDHLPVLFPLLLGNHRPGLSTWIDLAYPPLESDADDLQLLDCYLGMVVGRLVPDLSYCSLRGFMHTSRRLLACSGNPNETLSQLAETLHLFRLRVQDVMAGAVETGEGFLVETGLSDLRREERDFLSTGAAMGLWRWLGPVDEYSLHLVDLLTLAESPTVRVGESAWHLLGELAVEKKDPNQELNISGRPAEPARDQSSGWGLGGLRNFLPGAARQDGFTKIVDRVTLLATPNGKPGLLVLKGLMATGRHEAIASALSASTAGLEVTLYCPDNEAAAVFLEAAGPTGGTFSGDVRIVEKGITPPAPKKFQGHLADSPDSLIIMCEVQRFEKETRYRIAQMGRGRKLLMTIDPIATAEPWENLFLTTPRANEIVELKQPRRPARRLWGQVRQLLPENVGSTVQTLRSDKGDLVADYAVNLDQCLARLVMDVESGDLPDRLRLIGPLHADLDFLADSIRQRGWLAISENVLSPLLLPGVREVLAAATDLLSQGVVKEQNTAVEPGDDPDQTEQSAEELPDQPVDSESTPTSRTAFLLTPHLLPMEVVEDWRQWHLQCEWDLANMTLAEFFAGLETQPWARSFLAHPAATSRILGLLDRWAEESVAVLADTTLWEAWWLTTLAHLGLKVPDERRPLVTLAESSCLAGMYAPGGLYLCLGTEDWRRHYNVLARVSDQALILFKERSPLDPEAIPPS